MGPRRRHRPDATTAKDVERLRENGLTDLEIFESTTFIAFRLAFSTVDNALGRRAGPAPEAAPPSVRDAVSFGRPPAESPN